MRILWRLLLEAALCLICIACNCIPLLYGTVGIQHVTLLAFVSFLNKHHIVLSMQCNHNESVNVISFTSQPLYPQVQYIKIIKKSQLKSIDIHVILMALVFTLSNLFSLHSICDCRLPLLREKYKSFDRKSNKQSMRSNICYIIIRVATRLTAQVQILNCSFIILTSHIPGVHSFCVNNLIIAV